MSPSPQVPLPRRYAPYLPFYHGPLSPENRRASVAEGLCPGWPYPHDPETLSPVPSVAAFVHVVDLVARLLLPCSSDPVVLLHPDDSYEGRFVSRSFANAPGGFLLSNVLSASRRRYAYPSSEQGVYPYVESVRLALGGDDYGPLASPPGPDLRLLSKAKAPGDLLTPSRLPAFGQTSFLAAFGGLAMLYAAARDMSSFTLGDESQTIVDAGSLADGGDSAADGFPLAKASTPRVVFDALEPVSEVLSGGSSGSDSADEDAPASGPPEATEPPETLAGMFDLFMPGHPLSGSYAPPPLPAPMREFADAPGDNDGMWGWLRLPRRSAYAACADMAKALKAALPVSVVPWSTRASVALEPAPAGSDGAPGWSFSGSEGVVGGGVGAMLSPCSAALVVEHVRGVRFRGDSYATGSVARPSGEDRPAPEPLSCLVSRSMSRTLPEGYDPLDGCDGDEGDDTYCGKLKKIPLVSRLGGKVTVDEALADDIYVAMGDREALSQCPQVSNLRLVGLVRWSVSTSELRYDKVPGEGGGTVRKRVEFSDWASGYLAVRFKPAVDDMRDAIPAPVADDFRRPADLAPPSDGTPDKRSAFQKAAYEKRGGRLVWVPDGWTADTLVSDAVSLFEDDGRGRSDEALLAVEGGIPAVPTPVPDGDGGESVYYVCDDVGLTASIVVERRIMCPYVVVPRGFLDDVAPVPGKPLDTAASPA